MAGGTWTAQNKVRPGIYINVKSQGTPAAAQGTRAQWPFPAPCLGGLWGR